jgi:glutamine synthetase
LNTIVAHAITEFTKELVEVLTSKGADQPMSVTEALKKVIKSTLTKHKRIVYNGNGYSDKWVKIAEERGLPNFRECVAALDQFEKPENVKLFADLKVLLPQELGARSHVWFHNYCNSVRIEAEVLLQMVNTIVVPAAVKQQQQLADSVASLLRVLPANASPNQLKVLKSVNENIEGLLDVAEKLKAVLDNAKHFESKHAHKLAKYVVLRAHGRNGIHSYFTFRYMRDFVKPLITAARERSDALEEIVDDDLWALPKYSDMLFLK